MVRVVPKDNALAVAEFMSFYKESNNGKAVKRTQMEKGMGEYNPLPHTLCYLNCPWKGLQRGKALPTEERKQLRNPGLCHCRIRQLVLDSSLYWRQKPEGPSQTVSPVSQF